MKKIFAIVAILSLAVILGGCYTKILIRPPDETTAERWEEQNYYPRYYRSYCSWCSPWDYYYRYPWWLDQRYWWDNYSPSPAPPAVRERHERRRGLDEVIPSLIERATEPSESRETRRPSESQDSDDSGGDTPQENQNERTPRRRGLD
ncbi:MAG TPA: hypothetical protein ENN07_01165 [candidate division Zixibacteria bacterium]|nr:hypothetical protein [candidate division Zixibacteria bacterium]